MGGKILALSSITRTFEMKSLSLNKPQSIITTPILIILEETKKPDAFI